jgi:hypothetical protein
MNTHSVVTGPRHRHDVGGDDGVVLEAGRVVGLLAPWVPMGHGGAIPRLLYDFADGAYGHLQSIRPDTQESQHWVDIRRTCGMNRTGEA